MAMVDVNNSNLERKKERKVKIPTSSHNSWQITGGWRLMVTVGAGRRRSVVLSDTFLPRNNFAVATISRRRSFMRVAAAWIRTTRISDRQYDTMQTDRRAFHRSVNMTSPYRQIMLAVCLFPGAF